MALVTNRSTRVLTCTAPRAGFMKLKLISFPRPAATAASQHKGVRHPPTCAGHRSRSVHVAATNEVKQHLTRHQGSQLAVVAALAAVLNSKASSAQLSAAAPLAAPAPAPIPAPAPTPEYVSSRTSPSSSTSMRGRKLNLPGPGYRPRQADKPATVASVVTSSTAAAQFTSYGRTGTASVLAAAGVVAAISEPEVLPTSWNAFQKAYKGKGYSPAEMGQMWREHKARYLTTSSNSSSMRSTASPAAMVQTVALGAAMPAPAGDHSSIPTTWNAFQKANKGKGYSPTLMGQMWREHKARFLATSSSTNVITSSSYDVSMRLTTNSGPQAMVQTVAVSAAVSATVSTGAAGPGSAIPTTWNAFQKANKGRGFSPAEMGQRWREHTMRYML